MRLFVVHPGADISVGDVYDGLVPALRRLGHEVIEYPLSKRLDWMYRWLAYAWRRGRKNDPSLTQPTWADAAYLSAERLIPLALREQPDFVLVISGLYLHPDHLILAHRAGLRIALLLTESPYDDAAQFRVLPLARVAWTNERRSVPVLRHANPNVHYLPHAFDPERHNPAVSDMKVLMPGQDPRYPHGEVTRAHDVVFVGSGFEERVDLLAGVDWHGLGIDLGLYGVWHLLPRRHPLRRFVREGPIPNDRTVALYRRAKIGLNLYRTSMGYGRGVPHVTDAESLNPRALELAACGVFTLSDSRPEVAEVFGDAVPTFKDATGLQELVTHYLAHPAERQEKAARLPALVAGRTFDAMAARITADLEAATSTEDMNRRYWQRRVEQEAAG